MCTVIMPFSNNINIEVPTKAAGTRTVSWVTFPPLEARVLTDVHILRAANLHKRVHSCIFSTMKQIFESCISHRPYYDLAHCSYLVLLQNWSPTNQQGVPKSNGYYLMVPGPIPHGTYLYNTHTTSIQYQMVHTCTVPTRLEY